MPDYCLITGASGGLGVEFARLAAQAGYALILSARSEARLAPLAQELIAKGTEVHILTADLAQAGAAQALWQSAEAIGPVRILVNNAGLGVHGLIQSPDTWAQDTTLLAVNVTAAADLMKLAAIDMSTRGQGRILNVASSAAFMPGPSMSRYHASKAFLLNLSEAAASDLKGTGVTVTALCPGPTATGFFDAGNVNGALALKLLPKANAASVTRSGWRAMMSGKAVHIPGVLYKIIAFAMRLTPRPLATTIAKLYWRK